MSKVLIGITGSIAAYKTCTLISSLKKQGHEVKVVMTQSALQFVGSATVEGLTGELVHTDTFEPGKMMAHIHLARWADLFITAPCSLAQMARFANGLADNLITNIYFALKSEVPRYIARAMNPQMWKNPKTQDLLNQLNQAGNNLLLPTSGTLACGEVGQGRMMEPEDIEKTVFKKNDNPLRVLITSGGTKERIDSVRYIGNSSTGRTAATLADAFIRQGTSVDFLHAKDSIMPESYKVNSFSYWSFHEIKSQLQKLLDENSYDLIIHAAAVSDFSVENQNDHKIESSEAQMLKLVPNEKLITHIKKWAKGTPCLIGFKLTSGLNDNEEGQAIEKVLSHCDFVAHNSIEDINNNKHTFGYYSRKGTLAKGITKEQLASVIQDNLTNKNNNEVNL